MPFEMNKSVFVLLLWFIFIASVAYIIPYYSNDYRYMFVEGTNDFVSCFSDVFVSQFRHYFSWGGRSVAHVIAQSLLYMGKAFSAVIQGLCYLILIYLIYVHALGKLVNPLKLRMLPVLFICAALWFFLRAYAEVVFMLVSSCNYMFTTTYVLIFLLPFRFDFSGSFKKEKGFIFAIFMFVFGVISGWSNENTAFALCSVTGILCLYNIFYKKKFYLWQLLGTAGLCIGFLLLTLAPGNAVRFNQMISNHELHFNYFEHMQEAAVIFMLTQLLTLPLTLSYAYLYYKVKKYNLEYANKHNLRGLVYIFMIGFVSLAIMVFSPNFPARSATPFCICLIICTLGVYFVLESSGVKICKRFVTLISYAAAYVVIFVTASNALTGTVMLHHEDERRQKTIEALSEQGVTDPVLPSFNVQPSRYIFVGDISDSKQYFANIHVARYYKLHSVLGTCHVKKNTFLIDLYYYQDFKKTVCLLH